MDITATELNLRIMAGERLCILDVREEIEFHTFNIGGVNLPLGKLREPEDVEYADQDEIIVVCQRGIRSKTASRLLQGMGFLHARNLVGGLLALQRLNYS